VAGSLEGVAGASEPTGVFASAARNFTSAAKVPTTFSGSVTHLLDEYSGLTIAFQRASVASEVASTSFRFPETKSAHLKFSPLSDNNLWRLICLHAMYLFV